MRITRIELDKAGPLGSQSFDFVDSWNSSVHQHILFHGINGCGKSSLLRVMSSLWDATGYWLEKNDKLPQAHAARQWLHQWNGVAVFLEGVSSLTTPLCLIYGDAIWVEQLKQKYPDIRFLGESVNNAGNKGKPARHFFAPKEIEFSTWTEDYRRFIVGFGHSTANMIFLDAEERRWVKPRTNIGEFLPEDAKGRWVYRYLPREEWRGQLEASMLSLKTSSIATFKKVLADLNGLLQGKKILEDVKTGENRLQVRLKAGNVFHSLDDLSAGEHQMLIMVYSVSRWLEMGGIVLVDEPDQYLHPSLINDVLVALERLVAERKGQLFLTSHWPDVWNRYDQKGLRIMLEAK